VPPRSTPAARQARRAGPMKYLARKGCTRLSQIAVLDKSHSGWSGAPRRYLRHFTPGVSSTPVKDGGRPVIAPRKSLTAPGGDGTGTRAKLARLQKQILHAGWAVKERRLRSGATRLKDSRACHPPYVPGGFIR
jgi:hypothetical protein